MSEDALKVTAIVLATLGGLALGALIDGAIWRADCEAIGAHQSASKVYDCAVREKK